MTTPFQRQSATTASIRLHGGGSIDPLETARIVVVDDQPANVALLERLLRSLGVAEVHGLTDPARAVSRCLDVNADLLLLDLHMPGRDGFTVLDELHNTLDAESFLPVLVLTADATSETRNRALGGGATDFLTKPLDHTEVVLRVRNLLQTRALYIDVQARNATLKAELASRRAEEERLERQRRVTLARVDEMLQQGAYRTAFQPIVDLATDQTVGYEALTRFTAHPYRPPHEWFDDAHDAGCDQELELATATAALDHLGHLPGDAFLAINVSPAVAASPGWAALMRDSAPSRVVLELTEHSRISDYAALRDALAPLRALGLRIAVDDAGAGYAGLQHLLQLRPDVIKLDLELIRDIDKDPAKRALTTALVAFATDTGCTIVAEGIETAEELAVLRDQGVHRGQGYHLAAPGPLPMA